MKIKSDTQEHITTARELIDSLRDDLPVDRQVQEELAAEELVRELGSREAIQLTINALTERAKKRHPAYKDRDPAEIEREAAQYGAGLIEIEASELPTVGERLLMGKNIAAVVRAGQYGDLRADILRPIQALHDFKLKKAESFPRSPATPHTVVHLDTFYGTQNRSRTQTEPEFRYTITAAEVTAGQMLFIAGLASPAVHDWDERQYQVGVRNLNNSNVIQGLRNHAIDPVNPRGVTYKEWHEVGKGLRGEGEFVATTLNPGDVVIWPQGGEGARLPAWHGVMQIGNPATPNFEPRQSVSYHFSK